MRRARVIPCLLIRGNGLVKTQKYRNPIYIGDPVNAARIFSDKEVDELVVLDIDASRLNQEPNYKLIAEIAGECFMPVAYGGGIKNIGQIRRLIRCGIEKIIINTAAIESYEWICNATSAFGSQAIVGAIDVKKTVFGGYRVVSRSGTKGASINVDRHIANLVGAGVGEIFINVVDRDGLMCGYDIQLIKHLAAGKKTPIVMCGGAGGIADLAEALLAGADAVAVGSMFVFQGTRRAVLISYLDDHDRVLLDDMF